jgi:hypothetical protein
MTGGSRLPLLLLVGGTALLGGACASMQDFRNACSNIGYREGTLEHVACTERERDRYHQAINGAIDSMNQSIQQQNLINQMNRPRVCTRMGYSVVCY